MLFGMPLKYVSCVLHLFFSTVCSGKKVVARWLTSFIDFALQVIDTRCPKCCVVGGDALLASIDPAFLVVLTRDGRAAPRDNKGLYLVRYRVPPHLVQPPDKPIRPSFRDQLCERVLVLAFTLSPRRDMCTRLRQTLHPRHPLCHSKLAAVRRDKQLTRG